jgi:metallophosphoesterase superfamily enzyme
MEILFDNKTMILRTDEHTALLVSDIHLGFHGELSKLTGASFPPQHPSMLDGLKILVEKHDVTSIYVIGDVKHTISADSPFNWREIPEFMTSVSSLANTTIIPGNHDGDLEALLPRTIKIADVHGVVIGKNDESVGIVHGHAWPAVDVLDTKMMVIGHNHPTVRRVKTVSVPDIGRPKRIRSAEVIHVILRSILDKNCVRRRLGILEDEHDELGILVTLPSFNPLITGIHVNRPGSSLLGPIFENQCADLPSTEVYSPEGILLGSVESLRERFDEMVK